MRHAVVWGVGEMGGVFARGLVRAGCTVTGLTRDDSPHDLAALVRDPELVLVAVGERDLPDVLEALPPRWRSRVGLLQNELLPLDWERHEITHPTVVVAWFEKKPGRDVQIITASPVAGKAAPLVGAALAAVGIPAAVVDAGAPLLFELVRKNLYILTANIAGLVTGGNVGELWSQERALCLDVAREVLQIQGCRAGVDLDEGPLLDALGADFAADPDHMARGRSAPARLQRALDQGEQCGLDTPVLESISKRQAAAS